MKLISIWQETETELSWARVFSSITVLTACVILLKLVWTNHALPDAGIITALGVFAGMPYGLNKIPTAFGKQS